MDEKICKNTKKNKIEVTPHLLADIENALNNLQFFGESDKFCQHLSRTGIHDINIILTQEHRMLTLSYENESEIPNIYYKISDEGIYVNTNANDLHAMDLMHIEYTCFEIRNILYIHIF